MSMTLACGPGSPELSKSYMDMASKLFIFTFTFTCCMGASTCGGCKYLCLTNCESRAASHAGEQLFPLPAICFRMLQFRMFRMRGMIEHTALYGRNPGIRYAYVCAVYICNRINTDWPAVLIDVNLDIGDQDARTRMHVVFESRHRFGLLPHPPPGVLLVAIWLVHETKRPILHI